MDQKWHRLKIHSVNLERYNGQTGGMELLQAEKEAETNNIKLAWTPRWLLSPTAMETILPDLKRRTPSIKITITSVEDRDSITNTDIWFGVKYYRIDHFTKISLDTLYAACCH